MKTYRHEVTRHVGLLPADGSAVASLDLRENTQDICAPPLIERMEAGLAPPATALSLEQRLELFVPARHGGEVMANEPLRAEKW